MLHELKVKTLEGGDLTVEGMPKNTDENQILVRIFQKENVLRFLKLPKKPLTKSEIIQSSNPIVQLVNALVWGIRCLFADGNKVVGDSQLDFPLVSPMDRRGQGTIILIILILIPILIIVSIIIRRRWQKNRLNLRSALLLQMPIEEITAIMLPRGETNGALGSTWKVRGATYLNNYRLYIDNGAIFFTPLTGPSIFSVPFGLYEKLFASQLRKHVLMHSRH